jgi:hypothetical protein
MGRWMSPDPYMGSMDLNNPQSLNRYTYVGNNPLNWTDPEGLNQAPPGCELGGDGVWRNAAGKLCRTDSVDVDSGGGGSPNWMNGYDSSMSGSCMDIYSGGQYLGNSCGPLNFTTIVDDFKDGPGGNVTATTPPKPNNAQKQCTGVGRGLAGNTALVGLQGGIPGQKVQLGTAAVIPQQFGFPTGAALGRYASNIHGTIGKATFSSVTDVMGGKSPTPGLNVRTAMQQLFPGQLILEIPGASDQGSNARVNIFVPQKLGCPVGTSVGGG